MAANDVEEIDISRTCKAPGNLDTFLLRKAFFPVLVCD